MNQTTQRHSRCECSDKGCPACHSLCQKRSAGKLYRVDMEDAMDSGVFTSQSPRKTAEEF